eukprot:8479770-Pyramimonas_sp.AAC.1
MLVAQVGGLNASTPLFSPTPSTTATRDPRKLPRGPRESPKGILQGRLGCQHIPHAVWAQVVDRLV